MPTILDVVGLEMPKVYKGVEQFPLSGVSMRYTFDAAPDAPTQKKRQFYAMLGTRGMWEDGWMAAAVHAPFTGKGHFDQDQWQLYHVDVDRSESTDLAKENPEKLEALTKAWYEEAEKNLALPLDDRTRRGNTRPSSAHRRKPPRDRYVYYPGTAPVPEGVAVNVRDRSYKILANVEITDANARRRDLRARLALRRARAVHQGPQALLRLQLPRHQAGAAVRLHAELKPGKYTLGMEFTRTGAGPHKESLGTMKLYVNDKVVAEGPMKTQPAKFTLSGDGLCVGYDSGDAVSAEYKTPGTFHGGTIQARRCHRRKGVVRSPRDGSAESADARVGGLNQG